MDDNQEVKFNRRENDHILATIDKKLDQHSDQFAVIMSSLKSVSEQTVQIQYLQAMYLELRVDMNLIKSRIHDMSVFQGTCPKLSVKALWGAFLSFAMILVIASIGHILSSGGK